MSLPLRVPEVYYTPRRRAAEPPSARTDIAGFIGFEPRVRPGTTPSTAGTPGHAFLVNVSAFQVEIAGRRIDVQARTDFALSQSSAATPVGAGQSKVYALAVCDLGPRSELVVAEAVAAPSGQEQSPSDPVLSAAVTAAFPGRPARRIADVCVRRTATALFLTVLPVLPPARCDDWRDYVLTFGPPEADGTMVGPVVQSYFANGGRRCWVVPVRRPQVEDALEVERARLDFIGLRGSSEFEATGLERLLLLEEVTLCDVPDLYSLRDPRQRRRVPLPAPEREACFLPCDRILPGGGVIDTDLMLPGWRPVYDSAGGQASEVFRTQRALLDRARTERWRMLILLSVPLVPADGGTYRAPTDVDADQWRDFFDLLPKTQDFTVEEMSCGALYWPWLFWIPASEPPPPGIDPAILPPGAVAAGIVARRDLSRGPHVSPANETVRQVVGVTQRVDDDSNGRLYEPDDDAGGRPVSGVNVFRPFPGYGIQLWGARTLSTERWLRFLVVRRTLTAIELRLKRALDLLVFEPNSPALWMQITSLALSVLLPLYETGAFRGGRPEEAFYIRCDESVNPPESVALGQLVLEVGVAIAAPAEFIVIRVGRREGVIEVAE